MKLTNFINSNYSNHKKSKCKIFFPNTLSDLFQVIDFAKKNKKKILVIGAGLSWFDTIFNTNNILVNLKNYKKNFKFDKKKGTLEVSSSFKINQILTIINKHDWSLYSIPGADNVTIGGCIGNDVHGKDSFRHGNFCENIIEIEILLANKKTIKCSKTKNSKIYKSVVGGLGLIGIILSAKFNLKKIVKTYKTDHFICANYKEIIKVIYTNNNSYDYINGWINIFSRKKNLGSGAIFKSKKVPNENFSSAKNINTSYFLSKVQKLVFSFFVKNNLMNILNYFIFYLFKFKENNYNKYKDITYPLSSYGVDIKDAIKPNSFFEIQIILKKKDLPIALKNFILKCQELKLNGFVIGIKMHKQNNNYLSFSDNGVSININQIFNKKNFNEQYNKIKTLHNYIIQKKYKIYLCKDFLINKKDFRLNYNNSNKFLRMKKKLDPKELFYSDFYKRIIQ